MGLLPPPTIAITFQDFLDLLDRILPGHYIEPLKGANGYEMLQAYAAMFEALSRGTYDTGSDAQIQTAADGLAAVGEVELYRNSLPSQGEEIEGQHGYVASIVAGAPSGQARITGLTGMSAASVGRFLHLENTASPYNNGGWEIATYNSITSVDVINAAAVIPDANNGTIEWSEQNHTVTVRAGTVVTTSRSGRDFRTLADAVFTPSALGPITVAIEAVALGYEWNVRGRRIAADGEVLAGDIDAIKTLLESPELLDLSIMVRQIADTTGGRDASLNALGSDRGFIRIVGEATEAYRARISALPDTISPDAFYRTILGLLQPYLALFYIIETWSVAYQTCWDGPGSTITGSGYNPNLFAYDHPFAVSPFRGRWMDENDYRGGVIVVVDPIPPLRDFGLIFDDAAAQPNDFYYQYSTKGYRAYGAWDIPSTFSKGLIGAYDGGDASKSSLFVSIYDTLQAIKAAGVCVAVELAGE